MSDALTSLRTALAPKQGMRRIPLTMETYQHPSVPLSSKLLMNMYAEQEPSDARTVAALRPTPGSSDFLAFGPGPVHAINDDLPGIIYAVSGTHAYALNTSLMTATDLGDIGTPSGGFSAENLFYSIAVGPNATVFCSPPNAYVSISGSPVAQITTTWPSYGASSVAFLDGYFVFTGQAAPGTFFISKLEDPTMVDALDFASLEAFPNFATKVMTLGSDLWFGGGSGWEIWYNAGNADFPFRRRPNGLVQKSIGSAKSIAKGDDRLFWWSADGIMYRSNGYGAERISNHGNETRPLHAITGAYTYSQDGHINYVLEFEHRTIVYDDATKVWHNCSKSTDGDGPWRGRCATAYTGFPIIGDSVDGVVRHLDPLLSTDRSVAVIRQVVLPPLHSGTVRAFCHRLEIDMEVGGTNTPGDITLEWSDDGGVTYTGSRTMNAGTSTELRKRVYTTRLGSFRNRVFRVTSHHAMTIYGVYADIDAGNS